MHFMKLFPASLPPSRADVFKHASTHTHIHTHAHTHTHTKCTNLDEEEEEEEEEEKERGGQYHWLQTQTALLLSFVEKLPSSSLYSPFFLTHCSLFSAFLFLPIFLRLLYC
jgi:hypothetical protein